MNAPPQMTLELEGFSALKLTRPGRTVRFDPFEAPEDSDISLLTWNETERMQGVIAAIDAGRRPTVIAVETVLEWLEELGPVHAVRLPAEIDGLRIDATLYRPVPYATVPEGMRKLRSAVRDPIRALGRLRQRLRLPAALPLEYELRFPDGTRLVHLNCSLHRWTEAGWLEGLLTRTAGAEWMVAAVDFEEEEPFIELATRLEAGQLIVADLLHDTRRKLELTVTSLEPVVQALNARGKRATLLSPGERLELSAAGEDTR